MKEAVTSCRSPASPGQVPVAGLKRKSRKAKRDECALGRYAGGVDHV
jgi:hypothetical protein